MERNTRKDWKEYFLVSNLTSGELGNHHSILTTKAKKEKKNQKSIILLDSYKK